MPEKPEILVIDGNQNSRRKAMIDAFRGCATPYRLDRRTKTIESDHREQGLWEKPENPPTSFLIVLIHGGDAHLQELFPAKLRIWFGGEDGHDGRSNPRDYQIKRKILGPGDALSTDEARQLIEFARKGSPLPGFLMKPPKH